MLKFPGKCVCNSGFETPDCSFSCGGIGETCCSGDSCISGQCLKFGSKVHIYFLKFQFLNWRMEFVRLLGDFIRWKKSQRKHFASRKISLQPNVIVPQDLNRPVITIATVNYVFVNRKEISVILEECTRRIKKNMERNVSR
jgi:hypothetical protein